jgi:hypothetical protein
MSDCCCCDRAASQSAEEEDGEIWTELMRDFPIQMPECNREDLSEIENLRVAIAIGARFIREAALSKPSIYLVLLEPVRARPHAGTHSSCLEKSKFKEKTSEAARPGRARPRRPHTDSILNIQKHSVLSVTRRRRHFLSSRRAFLVWPRLITFQRISMR